MRLVPTTPDPCLLNQIRERRLIDLTVEVVTPMFGGGALPGVVDTSFPVNGKGVRGQLRFWWRACRAARYPTTEELFAEEARLWGEAARKPKRRSRGQADAVEQEDEHGQPETASIQVEIMPIKSGKIFDPEQVPYALFPFREQKRNDVVTRPKQNGRLGVSFRLIVSASPHVPQVTYSELLKEA